jgi:hypothetical protein
MCTACYTKWRRRTQAKKPATCHPDRPALARGQCSNCYQKWQREQNPGRRQKYYANAKAKYPGKYRLDKYGLSQQQVDEMLSSQGGTCAICGTNEPGKIGWCVDHDHGSGAVRGVLCASCNSGLGYFTDDTGKLENAKLYLARPRPRVRQVIP